MSERDRTRAQADNSIIPASSKLKRRKGINERGTHPGVYARIDLSHQFQKLILLQNGPLTFAQAFGSFHQRQPDVTFD